MTIEVDENLVGIWSMQITSTSDYLAGLSALPGGGFVTLWRFRHYRDYKPPPQSNDVLHWHKVTHKIDNRDRDHFIESQRALLNGLIRKGALGPWREYLVIDGDIEEFSNRLSAAPGMHLRLEFPGLPK